MKVMIHACPQRMWYVEEFLAPELERQGADRVDIWCDRERKGNLRACMEAFASCGTEGTGGLGLRPSGGGPHPPPSGAPSPGGKARTGERPAEDGTWHIQDDVLLCRDFVERCRQHDEGVVYGFCNVEFTDDPLQTGRVSVEDAWHSFQCVRIPDAYARECAAWLDGPGRTSGLYPVWIRSGKMDDDVFRTFLRDQHSRETVENLKPNLVDHVDWIIGGSILSPWRGHIARAYYWDDEDLVRELQEAVKGKVRYFDQ